MSDTATTDAVALSVEVVLSQPVALHGLMTNKLTMRRPKVKDRLLVVRTMANKTIDEQELVFLANLCELAPDDIENMYFDDYSKLQDALASFRGSAA